MGSRVPKRLSNGMPAPTTIADDVGNLRTRFWIATRCTRIPTTTSITVTAWPVHRALPASMVKANWIKLDAEEHRTHPLLGINGEPVRIPRRKPIRANVPGTRPVNPPSSIPGRPSISIFEPPNWLPPARRVAAVNGELKAWSLPTCHCNGSTTSGWRLDISANGLAFIIEPDGKLIAPRRART